MTFPRAIAPRVAVLVLLSGLAVAPPSRAQIVPDDTLPQPSQVDRTADRLRIDGGTTAGDNLFHSFSQFDVPAGLTAEFDNAPNVRHIITRVTGGNPSNLDGILRANGTANLYLLNPNGIEIGANAQLDIGGAFVGTTGDLLFADGTQFSAAADGGTPLLSLSVPVGVQLPANAAPIRVSGPGNGLAYESSLATDRSDRPDGFAVAEGQRLTLVAGGLEMDGGNLSAPYGRLEIGVLSDGVWQFGADNPLDANIDYGSAILRNASSIDASGDGAGEIVLRAAQLDLLRGSVVMSDTLGDAAGIGLDIALRDRLNVLDELGGVFSAGILASVDPAATGDGGSIVLEVPEAVVEVGILGADTFGGGNAGNFTMRSQSLIANLSVFSGSSFDTATGNAGQIFLDIDRIVLDEGTQVLAFSSSDSDGGNIVVRADELEIRGSRNAPEGREIVFRSAIAAEVRADFPSESGDITVDVRQLRLIDGGYVATTARSDNADSRAGNLIVRASESVEILGTNSEGFPSGLFSNTISEAQGANLRVETPDLRVEDGGQVSAGAREDGNGGRVEVFADRIDLIGSVAFPDIVGEENSRLRNFLLNESGSGFASSIISASEGGGRAGSLLVVADTVQLRDGAEITVSSLTGSGTAGNLDLRANRVALSENSLIRADSSAALGNITLSVNDLFLQSGSRVSTNGIAEATGGNIFLTTQTLVAFDNSDITAIADRGRGGRVVVDARGIFGIAPRSGLTLASDITASSNLGAAFSGVVELNTPDFETQAGLEGLPDRPVDVAGSIYDGCAPLAAGSEFVARGYHPIPDDPFQPLLGRSPWRDWRTPLDAAEGRTDAAAIESGIASSEEPASVREAGAWQRADDGTVTLVAVNEGRAVGGAARRCEGRSPER